MEIVFSILAIVGVSAVGIALFHGSQRTRYYRKVYSEFSRTNGELLQHFEHRLKLAAIAKALASEFQIERPTLVRLLERIQKYEVSVRNESQDDEDHIQDKALLARMNSSSTNSLLREIGIIVYAISK